MFIRGRDYHRVTELHDRFGGQRQGGICTPAGHPFIFLFTAQSGAKHGYRDYWRDASTFEYWGEGHRGDMQFVRGNKAILEHLSDGRRIYLFEKTPKSGWYRFIDELRYTTHRFTTGRDADGIERREIVFTLVRVPAALDEYDDGGLDEQWDAASPRALVAPTPPVAPEPVISGETFRAPHPPSPPVLPGPLPVAVPIPPSPPSSSSMSPALLDGPPLVETARTPLGLPIVGATAVPWLDGFLRSPVLAERRGSLRRSKLDDERICAVLTVLSTRGGVASFAELADAAAMPVSRVSGFLSLLTKLLNVDGFEVLQVDQSTRDATLNESLLQLQFSVA